MADARRDDMKRDLLRTIGDTINCTALPYDLPKDVLLVGTPFYLNLRETAQDEITRSACDYRRDLHHCERVNALEEDPLGRLQDDCRAVGQ